jgi:serine/threonine protein kinase
MVAAESHDPVLRPAEQGATNTGKSERPSDPTAPSVSVSWDGSGSFGSRVGNAREPDAYSAGAAFGSYRLVERIGAGGMGSVWIARHRTLETRAAVKVLRSDLHDPASVERFLNEARLLARIDHPAVVHVLDFGYTRRREPFLIMELLRGESVHELICREGSMAPIDAVRLILPICHGLAAVHEKKIVHRDIKPDNLFLALQDHGLLQPKVVDFGVARSLVSRGDDRLTMHGGLLGSPEYMSPEQARGELDIDERADVWGLAAVLYECITGARVYQMEDTYERLLRRIIDEPPKPISVHSVSEPELWRIIERGLKKRRESRWPSMEALGEALADWLLARGVDDDITGTSLKSARASGRVRTSATVAPASPAALRLFVSRARSRLWRCRAFCARPGVASVAAGTLLGVSLGGVIAVSLSDDRVTTASSNDEGTAADVATIEETAGPIYRLEDLALVEPEAPLASPSDEASSSGGPWKRPGAMATRSRSLVQRAVAIVERPAASDGDSSEHRDDGDRAKSEARPAEANSSVEVFYGDLGF